MIGRQQAGQSGSRNCRRIQTGAVLAMIALCLCWTQPGRAQTYVDLELVLALDASSSIAGDEFDLQIKGYAEAFRDPSVIAAISALRPHGIAVTLVQWSASFQQFQSVGWSHVHDRASAARFANAIATRSRKFIGFGTAIGSAIEYSVGLFGTGGFKGRRRVIDMSADERSNMGSHPSYMRRSAVEAGITVNALAVREGDDTLTEYFEKFVITGPAAFVISIETYADIAEAIRRKLLRELSAPIALAEPPADPGATSLYQQAVSENPARLQF